MSTCTRRDFLALLSAGAASAALVGCGGREPSRESAATTQGQATTVDTSEFKALALDERAWHYDRDHKVWWQTGLTYCIEPATKTYEQLAVYVPGAYLKPVDEKAKLEEAASDDTFEVTVDPEAKVGAFMAKDAPWVMPVNAPDFAAQPAATGYVYDGLEPYLSAGLIYAYAGCRGRSNGYDNTTGSGDGFFPGGAPWGVTDLKAAIRYLRYNASVLPGDTSRLFAFGHAAGGGLASVLGSTGDAPGYDAYLEKIGAATHDAEGNPLSDQLFGVMAWCPEVSPASADAAYEWGMGQFSSEGTRAEGTWTRLLSTDLAASYAETVNGLALRDNEGTQLSLEQTEGGVCTDGSYYEHVLGVVEASLGSFLKDTKFPHETPKEIDASSGKFPGDGSTADSQLPDTPKPGEQAQPVEVKTYQTLEDYLDSLNADGHWVTYNPSRGTTRVASLSAFASRFRKPAKGVCAFDGIKRDTTTNLLFGNDESDTLHFSSDIAGLLSARQDAYRSVEGFDDALPGQWADDLAKTDALETPMATRLDLYDPLAFLSGSGEDFGKAKVAGHWRVNTGLSQTGVPMTADLNLALALKAYDGVDDVTYTPVWGEGRVMAEPQGADPIAAFVSWVSSRFGA